MKTVFIVEDDILMAKAMKHLLRANSDLDIKVFNNGSKCFENMHLQPDIAVIDFLLPDMTGLDVMNKLHEDSPNTQCIIISGHTNMVVVADAIRKGAVTYIVKDRNAMIKLKETVENLYKEGPRVINRPPETN